MTQENKTQHETFYVSVGAAIYDPATKNFLVLKDANENGDYYKNFGPWELPGGRIHKGELALEALEREIREETSLNEFEVYGVVDAGLSPKPYGTVGGFLVTYLVFYGGGEIKVSEEHSEYQWMSQEEIENSKEFKDWFKERIQKVASYIQERNYLNDVQRLTADFENYKKRVKNDEKELYGHLTSQIVTELIPVLDNFHAATEHVPAEAAGSPWVTGITYIERQFEDVLRNYGVEAIEVKPGDPFDPTHHEALDTEIQNQESKIKNQKNKEDVIARVVQKGYKIKEKIIRPAKVITRNHDS